LSVNVNYRIGYSVSKGVIFLVEVEEAGFERNIDFPVAGGVFFG
jgi:hypothetical protein